jgi:hypothetical protein
MLQKLNFKKHYSELLKQELPKEEEEKIKKKTPDKP